jgi:chromosome segregation ATPase
MKTDTTRNQTESATTELSAILDLCKRIESRLETLENQIEDIKDSLAPIQKDSAKMGSHIDFVEAVYDTVRNPLQKICGAIQKCVPSTNETPLLPPIEQDLPHE